MINSYDQDVHAAIIEAGMNLANIFEDNIVVESFIKSNGDGGSVLLSEEGMEELGDSFEEIDPGLREAVFGSLLDELTERNIPYDIEQFTDKSAQVKADV